MNTSGKVENAIYVSGKPVVLTNPTVDMINIHDISLALSRICRFTGHTKEFYSVAEHSVRVCNILPKELKLVGLLHDATEAYLGDISSPLKRLLPEYSKLEDNFWKVVAKRWNLPLTIPAEVKKADYDVFRHEWRDLTINPPLFDLDNLPREIIKPMSPPEAKVKFLDVYYACLVYSEGC